MKCSHQCGVTSWYVTVSTFLTNIEILECNGQFFCQKTLSVGHLVNEIKVATWDLGTTKRDCAQGGFKVRVQDQGNSSFKRSW